MVSLILGSTLSSKPYLYEFKATFSRWRAAGSVLPVSLLNKMEFLDFQDSFRMEMHAIMKQILW